MNRWTFCFQVSVALVITILTRDAQRSALMNARNNLFSPAHGDRMRFGSIAAGEEQNGFLGRVSAVGAGAGAGAGGGVGMGAYGGMGIAERGRQMAFDNSMGVGVMEQQPSLARSPNVPIVVPVVIGGQQDRVAAYKEASSLNALGIFSAMNGSRNALYPGGGHQSNENLAASGQGKISNSPSTASAGSTQTGVIRSQSDELLFFVQQQEQQQMSALSSQLSSRQNNYGGAATDSDSSGQIIAQVVHKEVGNLTDEEEDHFNQRNTSTDESNNREADESYMMFDLDEDADDAEAEAEAARDSYRSISRSGASPTLSAALSGMSQHHSPPGAAVQQQQQQQSDGIAAMAGEDLVNRSGFLMWECGYCTQIGPKDRNEDRFECRALAPSREGDPPSSSAARRAAGSQLVSSSTMSQTGEAPVLLGGGQTGSLGYFGVYDGHSGVEAANYVEKELFDAITR